MGPGSTFTVEFSTDVEPQKDNEEALTPGVYVPTVVAEPEVETGVPYNPNYKGGDGAVTAQPTSGPYVPASYAPENRDMGLLSCMYMRCDCVSVVQV